ncbi:MAG TPA: hypothetical protein VJ978_08655 [Nitriliruptoraceae bacterium]|nr:hypothetical protein [Nitriliruptoraceae bacterium]
MTTPPPSERRHVESGDVADSTGPDEHVDPVQSGDKDAGGDPLQPGDRDAGVDPVQPGDRDAGGDPGGPVDPWPRRVGIIMAVGLGVGVAAALAAGATGASGQVGAVLILLVLSLAAGVGALLALVTSAVDEFRGRDVTSRRPVLGIVLFVAAAMLMAMTVAAAA